MRKVLPASDRALLLDLADPDEALHLLPALQSATLEGVTELVPAVRTILVHFDPSVVTAASLTEQLLEIEPEERQSSSCETVLIPVRYDGEDLTEVADVLEVSVEEVINRHQAAKWTVAFTGFAPGFGYLIGDDPLFDVPRRASPRTRIPIGSVALAGRFSGVYPRESPGGWQLIGRTDAKMWDLERNPPALLAPGSTVKYASIERELLFAAPDKPVHEKTAYSVQVVKPGLQLLVQDLGRPGMAAQGVAAAGAADRGAMREANRAVGNHSDSAVLEVAGGGAVLRFRGATVVSLSGALADASVAGRPVGFDRPYAIEDGDELRIGQVREGLRVIVGIRGGLAMKPVLGSLSTDTLAGLGPAALTAGDELPLYGPDAAPAAVERTRAPRRELPKPGDLVDLDFVLGPRDDWFTDQAIASLTEQEWEVTPRSDRVGVRLAGEALERRGHGELDSEGVVSGAIQVPADGQPVLFLADHPLTGGYPVVGAIADRHLDLAGQLPPGARIRFRLADTNR